MNSSRKGTAFEHEIRHLLEAHGYSVIRGAGSKGELLEEKTDLVATKLSKQNEFTAFLQIIGIQCKIRSRN